MLLVFKTTQIRISFYLHSGLSFKSVPLAPTGLRTFVEEPKIGTKRISHVEDLHVPFSSATIGASGLSEKLFNRSNRFSHNDRQNWSWYDLVTARASCVLGPRSRRLT